MGLVATSDVIDMELDHQRFSGASRIFPPVLNEPYVPSDAFLAYGTGGVSFPFFTDSSGSPELIIARSTGPSATPIRAIVGRIEEAFGLQRDQLAEEILHCSRKTLYNWLDGTKPRATATKRLYTVYRAALNWFAEGYPQPGVRLREPILGEQSLLDLLSAEPLDLEAIAFAGSRLALRTHPTEPLADPFA